MCYDSNFASFKNQINLIHKIMKPFHLLILLSAIVATPLLSFSQDSLVTNYVKKNAMTFVVNETAFIGNGWDNLINEIQKSDYVLLAEDHFTNEIPFFTSAITNKVKFDNFFCEIDPYSAEIITSKIKILSNAQLEKYVDDFGNVFSFFAMEPEFRLLKKLVKANTSVYGIDQVLMNADRLIFSELKLKTKNEKARKIYEDIELKSKTYFADFLKNPSKPMYLMTDDFEKQIAELLKLNVSQKEKEQIEALKLTAKIYKEQNHHLRVQLMKNNLMNVYDKWANKKNLFKYGAGHLPKGESYLKIYDIGSLVSNIADSQFKNSLHILVVGKSGALGSPFKGFPEQPINENSNNTKVLKPIFSAVEGNQWYCVDTLPLRNALENKEIIVSDVTLSRIINGFDFVVAIPKVMAAKFPKTE
ncbi:hypothetical protein DBB36_18750 [Flavobacterium sp. WLB]|nr:hypothetical protein AKO67_02900 [Flavobacterium sp. VMW]OWU92635.1 hypothetical protein APR43_00820 [Flavobacterium sp. NLM]PUU68450.1 hypothetical protein DBB36_18750 [Flavobacterium sp. WLB]